MSIQNKHMSHEAKAHPLVLDEPANSGERAFAVSSLASVEYNFVLSDHTVENADGICDGLAGSDIIAWEAEGAPSQEARANTNALLSGALADNAPNKAVVQAIDYLEDCEDWLLLKVVERFKGTGKRIELIDINADDERYDDLVTGYRSKQRAFEAALQSGAKNDELRHLLSGYIRTTASMLQGRDLIMAEQLRALGAENPGSNVGVMVGAAHTGIHHAIAKDARTTRVFARSGRLPFKEQKTYYTYKDQAVRKLAFGITQDIEPQLLDRALLHNTFEQHGKAIRVRTVGGVKGTENFDSSVEERDIDTSNIDQRIIANMEPAEVTELLEQIDEVKQASAGPANIFERIKTSNAINKLLNQACDLVESRLANDSIEK